jgi:serine O-acetyltransferase
MEAMRAATSLVSASKMDAVSFSSPTQMSSEVGIKPRFCAAGCVKCAPVSFAMRSNGSSSSSGLRSECSSSSSSLFSSSSRLATGTMKSAKEGRTSSSSSSAAVVVKSLLMQEKGAGTHTFADTRLLETLRDFVPLLESNNRGGTGTGTEMYAPDFTSVDDEIDMSFSLEVQLPAALEEDKLWQRMRQEARWDAVKEPLLASYLYSTILSHRSLESALAFHLGNKLSSSTLLSTQLCNLINDTFMEDASIRSAMREDIKAVKERDPAFVSYSHCMLNFKGYLACQAYRVAHHLWNQGRTSLALAFQSRISEVFQVDIHPAAEIGSGIMLDHATGIVVGETARIGNNVSILHQVTLGGTGAVESDRHPKIGDGVLIGAGAIILGNIKIGDGAKIGAGSIVLHDVPPCTTAVGNPARLLGGKQSPTKLKEIPSETMDHTSFIKGWSDYII